MPLFATLQDVDRGCVTELLGKVEPEQVMITDVEASTR